MLKKVWLAVGLALKDWLHEGALSLCAVLALASMLAPLLVLQGVKNGVVSGLRERLLNDPEVLRIVPAGGGGMGSFSPAFLEELRNLPEVRFVIGRTRDTATDITVRNEAGKEVVVEMEPCAPGEPTLVDNNMAIPQNGPEPELVLSAQAAQLLQAKPGTKLVADLTRITPTGQRELAKVQFRVSGVFAESVANGRKGFLPLQVLQDFQDYRDYFAVPARLEQGFTGNIAPEGERSFASFRLYAKDLDAVEGVAKALNARQVEARTKAREIANIRGLNQNISLVILIISAAVGTGFAAFTLSSVQGAVRRKDRMLGMLRLLGFPRLALLIYPLTQTIATALAGVAAAGGLYLAVAAGIDHILAQQSQGVTLCRLSVLDFLAASAIVLALSALASARAAWQAASIEPSAVIREV